MCRMCGNIIEIQTCLQNVLIVNDETDTTQYSCPAQMSEYNRHVNLDKIDTNSSIVLRISL